MGLYGSSVDGLMMMLEMIFLLAFAALYITAMWKIFSKAGQPGWAALVPYYNLYLLFKFVYGNGWKVLLMLIPIVNVVITILLMIDLARSFGKSPWFGAGLMLLPPIFILILAFDQSRYIGPQYR